MEAIQRSFTSGEIAPALRTRADISKYQTGLALCQNFIVRPQGGVYSRPGLRFVGEIGNSQKTARLIPFSFNTEQTYVLLFEEFKMRVIKQGGYVLAGGGPAIYELTTPYAEADLARLSFTQSADVMTIVHPDYEPRNLGRVAEDNWTLTIINYASTVTAPTWASTTNFAITNITQANPAVVTVASTTGLSNGDAVFITGVGGMVEVNNLSFVIENVTGTTFELRGIDSTGYTAYTTGGNAALGNLTTVGDVAGGGSYNKDYTYVVTAVNADGVESLPSSASTINTKSLSVTYGVRLLWNSVAGADYYRVYKDPSNGTEIYGWIGDTKTTQFDDFNIAPITSDAPPTDRQPFTGAGNRPAAVNYYQQRQVFANTTNEPQTVYTTQTGNYNSLRVSNPTRDTDAVTFTIAGRQVNEIRHIVALNELILLTSGGEWKVTEGQDEVLVPASVGVRIQSYNGSSWVPPAVINDTVVYVQEKGARLRDLSYSFADDKYSGNDLSIMSQHLFEDHTIVEMTYAAEPYGILWCVRSDGKLLGLTYQREHQVWGWHQHDTDGEFESITSITEGGRDAVYVVVKRTVNGSEVRYVERFEPRYVDASENAFCVDSGLTYDGAPATVISGLSHLEGKEVAVLSDGNYVQGLTVASGSITLPRAASKVHVGLAYTPAIETLDIELSANPTETLKAYDVSVSRVTLEVERSRGGWVGPKLDMGGTADMLEIKPRFDSDSYDTISLKTYKAEVLISPTWNKGGGVRIEQRAPLPMAILSVIPEIDVGG